ncbi:MAG: preprotein translocase subunit SecE [Marinilabiliaceae bacterium]|jgi:preprotein translocase subunit SecE|nr:preprotein translocase subunit SecE [Bacteroidales bacterium]MBR6250926.1 preprotein translocase subunit SecE [Bacteroidales bacterium]MCR5695399.1 preprotein translocase subunit SecE [Marinilabiliaceae bacterium]
MSGIVNYFKDVRNELVNKTSWPSWGDLINSARVVMVASLIIALIVLVMDLVWEHLLKFIYELLY